MLKYVYYVFLLCNLPIFGAINVNGRSIKEILKGDENVLVYELTDDANNISFAFKDNELIIAPAEIKNLDSLMAFYEKLKGYEGLNKHQGKNMQHAASGNMIISVNSFDAEEEILLQGIQLLEINQSILKAKQIYLYSNHFNLSGCFTNTDSLIIEAANDNYFFKAIQFTFKKDTSGIVQGMIDIENKKMSDIFYVIGARKMEILLSPDAIA